MTHLAPHTTERSTRRAPSLRAGDVVTYTPDMPDRHCLEGMAVMMARPANRTVAVDTYWINPLISTSDAHVLTDQELATARVQFNLSEAEEFDAVRSPAPFQHYAETDRWVITSQHGIRRYRYLRRGAQPDRRATVRAYLEESQRAANALAHAQTDARIADRRLVDSVREYGLSITDVFDECEFEQTHRACQIHGHLRAEDGGTTCQEYERVRDLISAHSEAAPAADARTS